MQPSHGRVAAIESLKPNPCTSQEGDGDAFYANFGEKTVALASDKANTISSVDSGLANSPGDLKIMNVDGADELLLTATAHFRLENEYMPWGALERFRWR
jgi:hypothetical protein